uniref:RNA helicase n=1 Tax=Saccoglossus kowalevskii TaxID=10224 RepID=A0ABM0MSY5_SACKO|nr:PREDICTED: probable ATP-dependent RNA helicase DHX37-like [Saccoglossus kowalevskii]
MGKVKRKFNWKARRVAAENTPNEPVDVPEVELDQTLHGTFDTSNALVLPAKKDKSEKKFDEIKKVRKLSKKKRKQLEKVIEHRKKKEKRAELLAALQEVQASKDEMLMFQSTAKIGQHVKAPKRQLETCDLKISSISGSNKKKRTEDDSVCRYGSDSSDINTSDMSTDDEETPDKEEVIIKEKENAKQVEVDDNVKDAESDKSELKKQESVVKDCENTEKKDFLSDGKVKVKNIVEISEEDRKPAVFVPVNRSSEIQEARLGLPILAEEQIIMETVRHNSVVIICGETGSGKTTQVPQFLYEAGYAQNGLIAVTEPRRVAAISMSKRVAHEMNLSTSEVSYQIRYEGNVSKETQIKFMTDGVLLKEIQKDFLLSSYSVVIIDEAHERSVYTDILIGLLSRIVPLRKKRAKPLKLIIMSATLRVEDFTENGKLFKVKPPVLKVDSRQYPVTVHFNKRTPMDDYMNEAYQKILKIHRTLPAGSILVFVTGQNEVNALCRKLKEATRPKQFKAHLQDEDAEDDEQEAKDFKKRKLPKIQLDSYSVDPYEEEEIDEVNDDLLEDIQSDFGLQTEVDSSEDEMDKSAIMSSENDDVPLHVLPLYSLLSPEKQARVFQPPPEGTRLCVVSTNVSETSLTIPGIKYVVDTGKVKRRYYDKVTGVSAFRITWTSKASANQRAGRAGRTEAGHCYRLYSSAVFANDFDKFSPPEITRRPVDDLILQMKDMNIDKVVNFPFPTPPEIETMKAAEKLLVSLGALEPPLKTGRFRDLKKAECSSHITPLGKAMACFPVAPRYAKMLALGAQEDCLQYVIAMVAALTVHDVFDENINSSDSSSEKEVNRKVKARVSHYKRLWAGQGESLLLGDLMVLLSAVGASEFGGLTPAFCGSHCLRYKAMIEIINAVNPDCGIFVDPKMQPPSLIQMKILREIGLAGMGDHVARRLPSDQQTLETKGAYKAEGLEDLIYIHPESVLFRQLPEYVIYQEVIETGKLYMRGITAIEPDWLPRLLPHMCVLSRPLEEPPVVYHAKTGTVHCYMTSTFGRGGWTIPAVELEYPNNIEKYKWFAKFLLEGKVIKSLAVFVPHLLSTPSTMVKSWAKLQPRTEVLLKSLVMEDVNSKDALLKAWDKNSQYLLSSFCEWLPNEKHIEVQKIWPPVKRKEN